MLQKVVFYTRTIITIIAPAVMFILPVNYFDHGESVCLSKVLAGYECYACGLTRASMRFVHLDFEGAWTYNKLVFIVIPLLFPLWLKAVYEIQNKKLPGLIGRLT